MVLKSRGRGFFAFDQPIVFDGGYRILKRQIPYKGFARFLGQFVFLTSVLFFKSFGAAYFSYIFRIAIHNAFAAILSVSICRLFPSGEESLSYISGLLTAAWFYPPIVALYIKHKAFFFALTAIIFILKIYWRERRIRAGIILPVVIQGADII